MDGYAKMVEEAIPRRIMDRAKNFVAQNSWARGYYVSTVSRDEEQGTQLHHREKMDKRLEQPKMFDQGNGS